MVTPRIVLTLNGEAFRSDDIVSFEYLDRFEDGADSIMLEFCTTLQNFKDDDVFQCWIGSIQKGVFYIGEFVLNEMVRRKFTTNLSSIKPKAKQFP